MAIEIPTWYPNSNAAYTGGNLINVSGAETCTPNSTSYGTAAGSTLNAITDADIEWEFRATLGGRMPNGRAWIGVSGTNDSIVMDPYNYVYWDYCVFINTETRTTSAPPHPANTLTIYEGSSTPKIWYDGAWENSGQIIRFVYQGGVMRYYLDCRLLYTSLKTPSIPAIDAYAVLGCAGMQLVGPKFVFGPNIGLSSNAIAEGNLTGSGCTASWTMPTPSALPQPPAANAPIATRFQETISQWGEYSQRFADQVSASNTHFSGPVRVFDIEWQGLSQSQAVLLDTHYDSTSGGLAFAMTHPTTHEVLTGCRYGSYSVSPHSRIWSQSRSATVIKYTA